MTTPLPIVLLVLCGLLLVCVFALFTAINRLRKELAKLDRQMAKLQKNMAAQAAHLERLTDEQRKGRVDPIVNLVETATGWRERGWLPTLALIAGRIVASYWKSRGRKALPVSRRPEVK